MDEHVWTIRELNSHIKELLENAPFFRNIRVSGEVSNCHEYRARGAWFFSLKEGQTKKDEFCVSCVIWGNDAARMRYKPKNGERFVVTASVTVYLNGGEYRLRVTDMVPEGVGDKEQARQEYIAALAEKGWFDPEHKKPLPPYPSRVGVVTSPTGDAVRDVIATLKNRWPVAQVVILPALVQGEKAALSIARAVQYANYHHVADVLIVGRGGGSVEDLDVFDDPLVVEAIFASEIPVVTAVGHTKNETIADLVSDCRAITPTEAGQIVSPDMGQVLSVIAAERDRLDRAVEGRLEHLSRLLTALADRPALTNPQVYLGTKRMTLDYDRASLAAAAEKLAGDKRRAYVALAAKLDALSPLKVLARGYSIAEKDGTPIRSVRQVKRGDKINVRLSGGGLDCAVEEVHDG